MAFLETPRFPECVSANSGWAGGPGYLTDIVVVESAREHRNQVWSYARHRFDASHAARRSAEYEPLRDFFHIAAGMANGFRVKDWQDYEATAANGRWDTIDATHFQMVKVYTVGASTRRRIISKPISGTVATSGTAVVGLSIDYATGIATVASGTLSGWSGEFDVPCRFDTDQMTGRVVTPTSRGADLLMDWDSIPIIEIRI